MRFLFVILLACWSLCSFSYAAEPVSTAPQIDPAPEELGAGPQQLSLAASPQFPAYLPNGAVNLDQAWIQFGGARYYWNTVIVPRQLNMGGAYWVDPALVPQLITVPQKKTVQRYYRSAKAKPAKPRASAATAATNDSKSPATPLPVEPVPAKTSVVPPPFSPARDRSSVQAPKKNPPAHISPIVDTTTPLPPPRLQ